METKKRDKLLGWMCGTLFLWGICQVWSDAANFGGFGAYGFHVWSCISTVCWLTMLLATEWLAAAARCRTAFKWLIRYWGVSLLLCVLLLVGAAMDWQPPSGVILVLLVMPVMPFNFVPAPVRESMIVAFCAVNLVFSLRMAAECRKKT